MELNLLFEQKKSNKKHSFSVRALLLQTATKYNIDSDLVCKSSSMYPYTFIVENSSKIDNFNSNSDEKYQIIVLSIKFFIYFTQ